MRITLTYVTPLLAAGAAAVAIVAAPTAAALPGRSAPRTVRELRASRPGMLRSTTPLPPSVFIPTGPCPGCSAATDTGRARPGLHDTSPALNTVAGELVVPHQLAGPA